MTSWEVCLWSHPCPCKSTVCQTKGRNRFCLRHICKQIHAPIEAWRPEALEVLLVQLSKQDKSILSEENVNLVQIFLQGQVSKKMAWVSLFFFSVELDRQTRRMCRFKIRVGRWGSLCGNLFWSLRNLKPVLVASVVVHFQILEYHCFPKAFPRPNLVCHNYYCCIRVFGRPGTVVLKHCYPLCFLSNLVPLFGGKSCFVARKVPPVLSWIRKIDLELFVPKGGGVAYWFVVVWCKHAAVEIFGIWPCHIFWFAYLHGCFFFNL